MNIVADPVKKFTKKITGILDNFLKTDLYRKAAKLHDAWHASEALNMLRRNINFGLTALRYRMGLRRVHGGTPLKLHLGCGGKHFNGYVNIDFRKTRATDLVCDIRKLPYPDGSAAAIETYHVVEHLPRHDFPKALEEWHRVLFSGGKLIVEYPDFDEIVKRYLEGHEEQIDGIFGLQRFQGDCHHFGYNYLRMRKLLENCGFSGVEEKTAIDYHAKEWPCIRVECIKSEKHASSSSCTQQTKNAVFTGERVVEGATPRRIWLDHVARYEFAGRYVKDKKVLDIACGTGYGSILLCRSGAKRVIGVDISPEAINFARTEYRMDGLEYKVGDVLDIDFPQNYFDVITCFETIEHVGSQEKAIAELQRVLRPGGLLIISSPNRKLTSPGKLLSDRPCNPFHLKEYSSKEFTLVLAEYFEILELHGQRGKWKLLFLPFFERAIRKFFPTVYSPVKGSPDLEKLSPLKEYRYITAVCRKRGNL